MSDTGNDQTLITSIWKVLNYTGREVVMSGAFAGRSIGEVFPVVSAFAKLVDEDGKSYAAYAHEALLDANPAQVESLLSVHQSLRDPRNGIDDRARCERDVNGRPGLQCSRFGVHTLPFYFDGTKCFYAVHSISEEELRVLPKVTLTDGAVPYEPIARLHSRRRPTTTSTKVLPWKQCLGFVPDHVVAKTLEATSQLVPSVEAETREMMRDHFQTRLPELKIRRVNDVCYVDTFFSSIPSIRGYHCWNLYSFKRTGLDVYLMQRRAQGSSTLSRMLVADCGAPNKFKSKKWMSFLQTMSIQSEFTEAHHPNENLAERRGGAIKAATVHLLRVTGCPLENWCYALEFVCLLRTVLARRSLEWTTPHEIHWGERPDISMFRFIFWELIWYYNPRQAFPKTKMMKGRFLGIAQNIGDAFCFLILTQPEDGDFTSPQVLARSVVRRRYIREEAPVVATSRSAPESLLIYKSDGKTPLDDWLPQSDTDDQLSDIVTTEDSFAPGGDDGRLSNDAIGMTEVEAFESGLVEVYGPPTKRPRFECLFPSAVAPGSTVAVPRQYGDNIDSEERPVNNFNKEQPVSLPLDDGESMNELRVTPDAADGEGPLRMVAATSVADSTNDDLSNDPSVDPTAKGAVHMITQEQDIEPVILDEIDHQLDRILAEDSTEDGWFDSI